MQFIVHKLHIHKVYFLKIYNLLLISFMTCLSRTMKVSVTVTSWFCKTPTFVLNSCIQIEKFFLWKKKLLFHFPVVPQITEFWNINVIFILVRALSSLDKNVETTILEIPYTKKKRIFLRNANLYHQNLYWTLIWKIYILKTLRKVAYIG